jgi:hypothetical protein
MSKEQFDLVKKGELKSTRLFPKQMEALRFLHPSYKVEASEDNPL